MDEFFCQPCLVTMPAAKFWIVFAIVSLGALASLVFARKAFIKARLIEDMPTSRVRSASQGYVELVGLATGRGNLLNAPLSGQPCLWWRYKIERYQKSGKSSSWKKVDAGISSKPFYMDDGTGICRIEPGGAEVSCLHHRVWRGATRIPATSSLSFSPGLLDRLGGLAGSGRYRYTEYLIRDGDPLYLLGHFVSDASGKRVLTIDQVAARVIREWKKDYKTLLVRFDSDGNGELDEREWAKVREAAKQEAWQRQRQSAGSEIDNTLLQPAESGLPFLIGSHGQEELSRKFRWQATGTALAFLALGALATWLLTGRFIAG